jgi:transposase-like protein
MRRGARKKIDDRLRTEIMSKLLEPVCNIRELSKMYGVNPHTLKNWRYNYRKMMREQATDKSSTVNFVELTVQSGKKKLHKASFVFDDVSVSLEGISNDNYLDRSATIKKIVNR